MLPRGLWPVAVGVVWAVACRAFDAEPLPQPGSDGGPDADPSEGGVETPAEAGAEASACGPDFVLDDEVESTPCEGGCDNAHDCCFVGGMFQCQASCDGSPLFECLGRSNYCVKEPCCLVSATTAHCQSTCEGRPELCTDSSECATGQRCVRQEVAGAVYGVCTECP